MIDIIVLKCLFRQSFAGSSPEPRVHLGQAAARILPARLQTTVWVHTQLAGTAFGFCSNALKVLWN